MTFDLQDVWTGAGLAAAALIVGVVFGFLQSILPQLPASGVFRNYVLAAISAGLVILAAVTSGAQPDAGNVFAAFLVFVGLYNASKNAHGGGEAAALRVSDNATSISTAIPDPPARG